MSLRSSINWLITVVMLLFICTLVALQVDASRRSTAAEMEAATRVTEQLLASFIRHEESVHELITPAALAGFLDGIGRIRAHDLQVTDAEGRVLHTSPPFQYKVGRSAPEWFAHLVAPPVAALTLPVGDGTLRIQPDNSRMVLDAWDELVLLCGLTLLLFALLNLLAFWFAGRAVKETHIWQQLIQQRVEEERRKLALELHDEAGQSLTAVRSIAMSLVSRLRDKEPALLESAQMIVDLSAQTYDAMHDMVSRLRPLVLDRLGLQPALQELVEARQLSHPELQFSLSIQGDLEGVSDEVAIAAYRFVQESLTNVVRHASASQASVQVTAADNLTLVVQDDGDAAPHEASDPEARYGLIGMRERAEALGGTFQWQRADGVRVVVTLPLQGGRR